MLRGLLAPVVQEIMLAPSIRGDRRRVKVHSSARVQNALFNVGGGTITVEENAFFGHNVCLLTGRHDVEKFGEERKHARGGGDIVVRRGAWIATNAVILGPCEIGEHAVVAAGTVVAKDVPPYHIVAGNPARVVRRIEAPGTDPQAPA